LILGFADGVIRVVAADYDQTDESVRLIQAIKPHKSDVSRMSMNGGKTLLISGSTDRTIFIFRIRKDHPNITLEPIGFIDTPSGVTAFSWKTQSVGLGGDVSRFRFQFETFLQFATALVGCEHGEILQLDIAETDLIHTSETYRLSGIKMEQLKFKSVKSQIKRDKQIRRIKQRKAAKRIMKVRKLKDLRKQNPDIRIDEATFLGNKFPCLAHISHRSPALYLVVRVTPRQDRIRR